MKTVYAVCCETRIDGGAPGYFIITTCDRLEDAEKAKAKLNTLSTSELDLLGNMTFNDYVFGYNEGACRYMYDNPDVIFISEIRVVESNELDEHLSYLSNVNERKDEFDKMFEAKRKAARAEEAAKIKEEEERKRKAEESAQNAMNKAREYYMNHLDEE